MYGGQLESAWSTTCQRATATAIRHGSARHDDDALPMPALQQRCKAAGLPARGTAAVFLASFENPNAKLGTGADKTSASTVPLIAWPLKCPAGHGGGGGASTRPGKKAKHGSAAGELHALHPARRGLANAEVERTPRCPIP